MATAYTFDRDSMRRIAAGVRTAERLAGSMRDAAPRPLPHVTQRDVALIAIDSEVGNGFYTGSERLLSSATNGGYIEGPRSWTASTCLVYEIAGTTGITADGTVVVEARLYVDSSGNAAWIFPGPGVTPKRSIEFDTDDEIDGRLQLVNDQDSATLGARDEMSVYAYDESAGDWVWKESTMVENIIGLEKNDTLGTVVATFQEQWVLKVGNTRTQSVFSDSGAVLDPTADPVDPDDATISGNLVMWLDANQLTGLSDGDAVSTWTDESGNGNSPTGSGSTRPLYKTNIKNGKPALLFDGTDDYLFKSTNVIPSAGNWTIFIVSQSSGNWRPLSSNDGTSETSASDNSWRTVSHSSNFNNGAGWVGDVAIGGSDTSWHLTTFDRVSASTLRSWLDGVAGASHTYTWAHDDVSVGRFHDGGSFKYHGGYIAEIIAYNAKLTDDQRNGVNAYLANKYGIAVSS